MIGGGDRVLVVFDHDQRVALVAQGDQRFEQRGVVARVEADGWLVEHIEHAAKVRAELCGEADALGFAAGECVARAVELQVTEADALQKCEAARDFRQDVAGDQCRA